VSGYFWPFSVPRRAVPCRIHGTGCHLLPPRSSPCSHSARVRSPSPSTRMPLSARRKRGSTAPRRRRRDGVAKTVILRANGRRPASCTRWKREAQDSHGNSASFAAQFYGFNSRVPRLLINEFTPRGSGNHPDLVELKALSAGNMGGVVFFLGTPDSYDARLVFLHSRWKREFHRGPPQALRQRRRSRRDS